MLTPAERNRWNNVKLLYAFYFRKASGPYYVHGRVCDNFATPSSVVIWMATLYMIVVMFCDLFL